MGTSYTFRGELWLYPEEAGWHFITLPEDLAEQLREDSAPLRKGFGSVGVSASAPETRSPSNSPCSSRTEYVPGSFTRSAFHRVYSAGFRWTTMQVLGLDTAPR